MLLRLIAFFLFFLLAFGLFFETSQAQSPSSKNNTLQKEDTSIHRAPLIIDGTELFWLRGIKSYPAERRVKEIKSRILQLAKDPDFDPKDIKIIPQEKITNLVAGDTILLRIFPADTDLEGIEQGAMSLAFQRVIQGAIKNYRADRQPGKIRQGVIVSIIATLVFGLLLIVLRFLFKKIHQAVERKIERADKTTIKFKSVDVVEAKRFWQTVGNFFKGLRILLILVAFYFYLEIVFSQFPWTRFIAARLINLVLNPLKTMAAAILDYIPDFIFLLFFIATVTLFLKFLKAIFNSIQSGAFKLPGFEAEWARPTFRLLRILVLALSLVIAYPYIPGSDSDAFKGVSLFLGLLVSLGSSSAIANIIAGYSLIYRRAYNLGDRIQVGEVVGDVTEMRLLVTRLRTLKNEEVTVPNSLILNSNVINYSTLAPTKGLILHSTVGIGYEVPWRQVQALLIRAAERTDGLLKYPPPFVLKKTLGDFAISYEINAYCKDSRHTAQVYNQLNENIVDEFNEHEIQIMTPAYERDPETPKIVSKDKWFTPPASPEGSQ